MLTKTALGLNSRFKAGWIILLVIAALMTFSHFSLIFFMDEPSLFSGFAAFNFYSLIVIMIPFRRGEPWAWWISWILPIGLAVPAATDPNLTLYYFGIAAFCVLGLLLTRQVFFRDRMRK